MFDAGTAASVIFWDPIWAQPWGDRKYKACSAENISQFIA